MDSNVAAALISGICSIVSAFGAVYLKEHLDARRAREAAPRPDAGAGGRSPAAPAPEPPAAGPGRPASRASLHSGRPLAIILGSFLLGVLTRILRPLFSGPTHWESLVALVILIALVLALALSHRRRGSPAAFQLENLAIWTGWGSGWSLIQGGIWSDLLGVVLGWWLGCALVGGLLVALRRRAAG